MKKIWAASSILILFIAISIFVGQASLSAEPEGQSEAERISQDAERNRELLDIWKEHVKTLTKERDDAYRQIERIKVSGGSPVAQFGGVESAPLAPSPVVAEQIAGLQTEVGRLQTELQKKAATDPNREMQMQYSSLQKQFQQLKKELAEGRTEKDRLIQEKEKALSQVERLEGSPPQASPVVDDTRQDLQKAYDIQKKRYEELQRRFEGLERENSTPAPAEDNGRIRQLEAQIRDLTALRGENDKLRLEIDSLEQTNKRLAAASGDPQREEEAFARQARELQYQNDTLKAQIEKLQVVEKELSSTRAYFSPLVQEMQGKNDQLSADVSSQRSENAALKSQASELTRQEQSVRAESEKARRFAEAAQGEIDTLKIENQRAAADLRTLRAEHEQTISQNESLSSQLQMAAADREKIVTTENELRRTRDQYDSLQKAYAVLEQTTASHEIELQKTSQRLAVLNNVEREREKYKSALAANLTDMKNLKSNFEAYLESLVASFEERQK